MDLSEAFNVLEAFVNDDPKAKTAIALIRHEIEQMNFSGDPPLQNELPQFVEHLHYEYWMFFEAYRLHLEAWKNRESFSESEKVKCNALLESYLLHSRNLIEFFSPPKKDKISKKRTGDGIYAIDYLGSWKLSKEEKHDLCIESIALNKWLQHVTVARTRSKKPDQWGKIHDIIHILWNRFDTSCKGQLQPHDAHSNG